MQEERKLTNQIRKELIDGSLGNADNLLRYGHIDTERVYYVVPSRNKSIFLLFSSPLVGDTLYGSEIQHFITAFKIYKSVQGMKVKGLTKIPVSKDTGVVYRNALGALIRQEFHDARNIVPDGSWSDFEDLKEALRVKITDAFIHGTPVLSEKQLRDLNNQRMNIPVE
jgi:hypothetical protein